MKSIIEILKKGGVGVLPTDTLYGLVGSALFKKAVERIYRLRARDPGKPMIVLLSSLDDLEIFGVGISKDARGVLRKIWPGKISVVLPCPLKKYKYLHRGLETIAFRVPKKAALRRLLKQTGPLVAPSVNISGQPPARTLAEAKKYFGVRVDFYYGRTKLTGLPSTLVAYQSGKWKVLRQGAFSLLPRHMI